MARILQFRRGDTATSNAFTGSIAELFVDTDTNELILHDGVTTGGYRLAKKSDITNITITESQISDFGTYQDLLISGTNIKTINGASILGAGDITLTTNETDPVFTAWDKSTGISITESQITDFGTYQDLLISGTNIKTINGASILGAGDLVIDTGITYTAGTGLDLTGTSFSLESITAGSTAIGAVAYNGTTKADGKFDGGTTAPTNTTRLNYDGYFYATKFYGDGSALTGITESQITDLGSYQPLLVSGTNIKTINGTSVLGTGDIVISGGDADTLNGQLSSYYLDYSNFTNTPTIPIVNDVEITISGSDGLSGSGVFTTNQGTIETITLSNTDKGSSQNIFKTISVSGQNDIVADSNNDTLTFVAGANITIITDTLTNSITITGANPGESITYAAGTGLTLNGTTFNHTNSIVSGTASEGGVTRTLSHGGTFNVPSITYDAQGHISSVDSVTLTLPSDNNTTYTAGTGLDLTGTSFSLESIAAGSTAVGAVSYNGTTKADGKFDGGTTAPTNTTRLNYDGYFYATKFYGNGSALTGITESQITDLGNYQDVLVSGTNIKTINGNSILGAGDLVIDTGGTYTAGTGLTLNGTTFNHTNSIVSGTASEGGVTRTLSHGGTFNVPSITYDAQGHISSVDSVTLTLPSDNNTTYTAGTGLDLTGTVFSLESIAAGSTAVGAVSYNGTTKADGKFDGGTTAPTNTTRLNYDGYFYATKFYGDGSALTGISGGATLSNDTTTDTTQYLGMSRSSSGAWTTAYVADTKLYFNPSTGTLNSTAFNSLSDINFKTNITPITNAIDTVNKIEGVEFDWKENGIKSAGVIAQQLEQVLPHLVSTNKDGIKSVNYDGIIGYLIEAVKELSAKLETK